MRTLLEYIYAVKNPPNGGMTSRASELGERLVASWVNKYRNMLVAQDCNKRGNVDSSVVQDLGCLTLIKADASMCSAYCWGEEPVFYIDLPPILELDNNMGLVYFGLIDKQTRIPIQEFAYGSYSNYNRFAPKKIYGEQLGDRVFLHNVDPMFPIEAVNARAVFSDPFNLVTDTSPTTPIVCYDWGKDKYPMLNKLDGALLEMIYTRELGIMRNAITDKTADDVTEEKA